MLLGEKQTDLGVMCSKVQEESPRRAQRIALGISIPPASRAKLKSNPQGAAGVAGQVKHIPLADEESYRPSVPDMSTGEPNTWGALTFSGNRTK